ncbi:MAG: NUDIX domain-containing protein [Planctomycetota bacterium]|nr:MAG: NUDIX domain-containing protein [Planctomycetota bacterium]
MKLRERSAGVVPLRRTPEGWRVLLLRAYRLWDFPKGRVEPGEELLAAAVREAKEEAALDDLRFPWGREGKSTAPYGRGKVATYFLGETERAEVTLPVSPELGRPEHHEGRWVSFEEAARLLPQRLQPILAWARERVAGSPPA